MQLSLVVGTPMYGGQCAGPYSVSVGRLHRHIASLGGKCGSIVMCNESLVNRARNSIVWQFLNMTDAKSLLFCDADQGFESEDVVEMMGHDKAVIAAPVPLKGIDWDSIAAAARRNVPAEELARHGGIFNVEHLPAHERVTKFPGQPFRVNRVGSAFMLIQRHVFSNLADRLPSYTHDLPDEMEGAQVTEFFPVGIDEGRLMSEDYGFVNAWKGIGGEVWLAPRVEITHWGNFAFTGSYRVKHDA